MNIVERAAERLKSLQTGASPVVQIDGTEATPDIPAGNRQQEKRHATGQQLPDEVMPPWHVSVDTLREIGLIPTEREAESRLVDELRRVKRPLLDQAVGSRKTNLPAHRRRIVVTSAVPGEGKTFTAMNLALSMAREPDFEVVLVDGDIPKADITRALGLQNRPGLMDVLANQHLRPEDAIVCTDIPNLQVVPAGTHNPLTAELFRSRRMKHVLDVIGGQNQRRLLVFDSAPLLATSESQVMAAHMGQAVMVVAAGRTGKQELKAAMQCLEESLYVGLVLNMSRLPASESYYYGYYSDYGSRHAGPGHRRT